jgi:hypothetical protein
MGRVWVGSAVGGSEKSDGVPNTEIQNTDRASHESCGKESRNPQKYTLASKVANLFTCALVPLL